MLAACGGGGGTTGSADGQGNDQTGEIKKWEVKPTDAVEIPSVEVIFADVHHKDEGGQPETKYELLEISFDLVANCSVPPFDFGCPCDGNTDCAGGWCVEGREGKVCSQNCYEECPDDGFTCEVLSSTCPDCEYVCIPKWLGLCRPCNNNSDCQQSGYSTGSLCVSWEADGSFCGAKCESHHDCPTGYDCNEVPTADTIELQCQPKAGLCACTLQYVEDGATTDCYSENEFGTCFGERYCSAQGLSDCDAPPAEPEQCDGLDNDCDGGVDEEQDICGGGKLCLCTGDDCGCVCPEGMVDCGSGVCVDLQTDVAHCGGCNDPCQADNVETFVCQGGQCKIAKCQAGFENFNTFLQDGCECPIEPEVCDGADNDCDGAVDEGDEICPGIEECEGTCEDGLCICPAGCDLCDGICVPLLAYWDDPSNCGYCGNMCALDNTVLHYCEGGVCGPLSCQDGWANCDGWPASGCEWEILPEECNCVDDNCNGDIDEQPLMGCPPPKVCEGCLCQCPLDNPLIMDCGEAGCVDISATADHCGWCDNSCTDMEWPGVKTYGCEEMMCTILQCEPNFFDVNTQQWDGCECEKTSSAELCDLIDNDCDGEIDEVPLTDCPAPKICEFGFCSCPLDQPNLQECEVNKCTDILVNPDHCGWCDNDCDDMGLEHVMQYGCETGMCTIAACQLPWVDTNELIFDGCECEKTSPMEVCDLLDNDCDGEIDELPNNCIPPKLCMGGDCICPPDQPNLQDCGNGFCTDTYTNADHCGFCGNACELPNVGFQKCEEGLCVVAACKPGFKDCNTQPFDGCEFEIKQEECNGFDDDCDGDIDEGAIGIGQPCDSNLPGLCSNGIQSCEDGLLKCNPNIQPDQFPEVCDGKDNDCDGAVDEENPGGGGPCTVQGLSGECKLGQLECTNGSLTCKQVVFPQAEICDNKDNDCDGQIDGMQEDCFTMCGDGKKTCNGGQWGACSAMEPKTCMNYNNCQEELVCVQQCDPKPQETCNGQDDDCDWEIDETFACTPGEQKDQNCGNCGSQTSTCSNNCTWGQWSPCNGEGDCNPGQSKYEGSCGDCGQAKYTCSNQCFWDYSGCTGEGQCSPGSSKLEGSCGKCGQKEYSCSNSCSWSYQGCTNEGVCSQGQSKTEGSCGNCGDQQYSCNSQCQWQKGSCVSQGACSPGSTKKESSCGNCGKKLYQCTNSCSWSYSGCTDEGPCSPGQTQWCNGCEQKSCSGSCQWSGCDSYCGGSKTGDNCYCDSGCVSWGDCCDNAADECDRPTCIGQCGSHGGYDSAVGGDCWCDSGCVNYGDCCVDARDECGVHTCRDNCGKEFSGCDCDWNCWMTSCCADKDDWCG